MCVPDLYAYGWACEVKSWRSVCQPDPSHGTIVVCYFWWSQIWCCNLYYHEVVFYVYVCIPLVVEQLACETHVTHARAYLWMVITMHSTFDPAACHKNDAIITVTKISIALSRSARLTLSMVSSKPARGIWNIQKLVVVVHCKHERICSSEKL